VDVAGERREAQWTQTHEWPNDKSGHRSLLFNYVCLSTRPDRDPLYSCL